MTAEPNVALNESMYMPDFLHPSTLGYSVIADHLRKYVKSGVQLIAEKNAAEAAIIQAAKKASEAVTTVAVIPAPASVISNTTSIGNVTSSGVEAKKKRRNLRRL